MRRSITPSVVALALTCMAQSVVAQDAGSCVDEVQRLDEGLPVLHDQASAGAIAQEPGTRKGASLGEDQRRQIAALVEQARTAGKKGDSEGCMRSLTEARGLLREAGFGSGEPGIASDVPAGAGRLGRSATDGAAGSSLPAPPRGVAEGATAGAGGATTHMGSAATGAAPRSRDLNATATGARTRGGGAAGGGVGGGAAR
jgi:hypothetical protein